MPVIDLKDYLGMPQQAPAQPVFQATTQNVDPMALRAADPYSSDAFLANVEARQRLAGLQRLAPVFQAQQAQLAYDQVAEQARQLRQKQEIEAQVQRATEEITQGAIDPESDQFNQQVMGLYTRNPMAFADNRMQQAMSFLGRRADELAQQKRLRAEAEYDVQQGLVEARQKEREELDKLRIDAIDSGAPQDLVLSAKSPYEVAALKAQYGGRTERDIRGQMMEKDLGLLAGEMKRLEDLGEDAVTDEAGKTTYTPRYQSLMDEATKLQGELRGFYQSKYRTPTAPTVTPPPAGGAAAPAPAPTAQVQQPPSPTQQIDLDTQLAAIPFAQQREFLERAKIAKAEQEAIAPAWTKAKTEIGDLIKKVVPDKPLPGTKVNELESFARAVLNPNENIIQHPEYGSIPVAWDILNKAGVPMAEIMTNATVFRQPGEGRRLLGFIGTQQVGYQELLRQWAKDFLDQRGQLLPTSQSPTGSTLTPEQQKDLNELDQMARSK